MIGKLLYLVFFWVITLLILLYVGGVRYNWQSRSFLSSASLSLTSYFRQKTAVSYVINGEEHTGTLPLILNWLTPGYYNISLRVEGKRPWERSLKLAAGQAVPFENILFLNESIVARPATENERAVLKRITVLVDDGLLIRENELIDQRARLDRLVVRMSHSIEQALWYPRQSHILVRDSRAVYLMEEDGTNINELFTLAVDRPVKLAVTGGGATVLVDHPDGALAYDLF